MKKVLRCVKEHHLQIGVDIPKTVLVLLRSVVFALAVMLHWPGSCLKRSSRRQWACLFPTYFLFKLQAFCCVHYIEAGTGRFRAAMLCIKCKRQFACFTSFSGDQYHTVCSVEEP